MEMRTAIALGICLTLSACVVAPYTHSDKAAELTAHPVYTATPGYFVVQAWGFMRPTNYRLSLGDGASFSPCMPPSYAEYQANPGAWLAPAIPHQGKCSYICIIPLPAGTAVVIDTVDWSWDFENGEQYYVAGHLLDPKLPQNEFPILQTYYIRPCRCSKDDGLHLNPQFFVPTPPATTRP